MAEHTFHLALVAAALLPQFPELNAQKTVSLALHHDLAETLTGDVSVYAPDADRIGKHGRELEAALLLEERAYAEGLSLAALDDYLRRDSAEANFVYALDKIVPFYLVLAGVGHHANPTLAEYDRTATRARAQVLEAFPKLVEVFDVAAARVRDRVRSVVTD